MRVLVTGANGFVGSHVAEHLAGQGHELRLLLRRTSRLEQLADVSYERVEGEMRDTASLRRAVEGIEAVIHVAGLTTALHERDYIAVNAQGTQELVRAAVDAGVDRFVYASSLAAQGPSPDGRPQPPELPRPVSAYGRSKLGGERAVLAERERLNVAVLRLPVVYGPRDRGLLPFYRLAKTRLIPLYGDGLNRISWVHVHDAANAFVRALDAARSGAIFTVADGEPHTWRDLVGALSAAHGRRLVMLPVPPSLFSLAAWGAGLVSRITRRPLPLMPERLIEMRQRYWVCDYERAALELGWKPTIGMEEGVAGTLRWYRQHGWL